MAFHSTNLQGLNHAIQLDGEGGFQPCYDDIAQVWNAAETSLWLHFDYSAPDTSEWLLKHSGLNDLALQGLTSESSRPHILKRGNNLLAIFRAINLNPNSDPEDMVSLRIWTDGKRIISTRRRPLISTTEILERLESGEGPKTISQLLIEWLELITEKQEHSIHILEEQALVLEDADFIGDGANYREQVNTLRKACISLRRYLLPQKEALAQLSNLNINWLSELDTLRVKAVLDRQLRCLENIEMIREHSLLMIEELNALDNDKLNRRTYIFTVIAGMFLPLGFFTGLLGINVGGMPGTDSPLAFWIVVALCIGFGLGSLIWAIRNKWL
ncbi:zinc transporter ZntB [Vibrio hangzhouensis]|uniref:zinc transporter ZntB n=1 Tax=Vibrio hangzhouensis TaxID=462991 RepID=UPI001C979B26|nr:zinc transporter ZntB [Vibrio hangzhouensis]MBY6195772.1 zinc transporter ZntB [Vibrio hangzhouensis]